MFKLLIGFLGGLLVGFLLGQVASIEFFFAVCLILIVMAGLLLIVLHLGLRDFQEY